MAVASLMVALVAVIGLVRTNRNVREELKAERQALHAVEQRWQNALLATRQEVLAKDQAGRDSLQKALAATNATANHAALLAQQHDEDLADVAAQIDGLGAEFTDRLSQAKAKALQEQAAAVAPLAARIDSLAAVVQPIPQLQGGLNALKAEFSRVKPKPTFSTWGAVRDVLFVVSSSIMIAHVVDHESR